MSPSLSSSPLLRFPTMAVLSTAPTNLTFHLTTTTPQSSPHHHHHVSSLPIKPRNLPLHLRPACAFRLPSQPPPPSGEVYQPFRPPPSPLPEHYRSLSANEKLDLLRNRMGLWYQYAPLIKSLSQEGFTPPSIEEATGITGVEQNRLAVASQVRDSLVSTNLEADILAYFDTGGAELLYEIRLLSVSFRVASARYIVEQQLDAKSAQQLARAIKDFPRRRGEKGWEFFSESSPGDCLAYSQFRLGMEVISSEERMSALERALQSAETEKAKEKILKELECRGEKEEDEEITKMVVPVVRLRYGEVAEATSVAMLPVCLARDGEQGVLAAPQCQPEGEFRVVVAEAGWDRWVVLPGWEAVRGVIDGIAVEFADPRIFPWRVNRWEKDETVMVVADRGRKEVVEEYEFYLVGGNDDLKLEKGKNLQQSGVDMVLGTVVLFARQPRDDQDDQLQDEEWE